MTEATLARPHELHCHPATPAGVALSLTVRMQLNASNLVLQYRLLGPIASLRIPPAGSGGAADDLWQHTCFEAFMAAVGDEAYREFNFSPAGQWAVYRFQSERMRDSGVDSTRPVLHVSTTADCLELTAHLPLVSLPASTTFNLGLCTVVEEADGRLSYWALEHPKSHPDFHHRDGRTLRLAMP